MTRVYSSDQVCVLCADLRQVFPALDELYSLLSADERQRADSYRFQEHRRYFVARRGLLRQILGAYLQQAPESLQFTYGLYGKPALKSRPLQFSMSHSNHVALYAVASSGDPLGVDLEWIRDIEESDAIARSFFSPAEYDAYRAVSSDKKLEALFTCWTRKEAYLKATGEGLSGDMTRVSEWRLLDLAPARGYLGALAIKRCGIAA